MTFSLIWLPDVLLEAKLKIAFCDGWENRGRGEMGPLHGIICHHTAGGRKGNMPSLGTLIKGRPDLQGPLCQLGLGRDGTFYIVAAGRANHAGAGIWRGVENGNGAFIGIEAENAGINDPWPEVQMDAYRRGVAALLQHAGLSAEDCAGHKEYALPHGRKSDPSFDMVRFRSDVATFLGGSAPAPVLIPPKEPTPAPGKAPRLTLRRGATGEMVSLLQKVIGVGQDGQFGGKTEAAVRQFQRDHELVADGIVGPGTWKVVDQVSSRA
jgi:peptidoglycan hydrolase-like protein with peptidoglycan-binding domain